MMRDSQTLFAARSADHATSGARDVISLIGNTPLLDLNGMELGAGGVEVLGKAEWFNPGGSVKDRAAAAIIAEAERSGRLRRGVELLDSTSGNTGIAYAMIGAARGFGVTLCIPE